MSGKMFIILKYIPFNIVSLYNKSSNILKILYNFPFQSIQFGFYKRMMSTSYHK